MGRIRCYFHREIGDKTMVDEISEIFKKFTDEDNEIVRRFIEMDQKFIRVCLWERNINKKK